MKKTLLALATAAASLFALSANAQSVKESDWGKTSDGTPVKLYTMKNAKGMTVQVTNFGGRIVKMLVPDRNGKFDDIVLGYDKVADYEADRNTFRRANRQIRQQNLQRDNRNRRQRIQANPQRQRRQPYPRRAKRL